MSALKFKAMKPNDDIEEALRYARINEKKRRAWVEVLVACALVVVAALIALVMR